MQRYWTQSSTQRDAQPNFQYGFLVFGSLGRLGSKGKYFNFANAFYF